jgi:hypothetical protein
VRGWEGGLVRFDILCVYTYMLYVRMCNPPPCLPYTLPHPSYPLLHSEAGKTVPPPCWRKRCWVKLAPLSASVCACVCVCLCVCVCVNVFTTGIV